MYFNDGFNILTDNEVYFFDSEDDFHWFYGSLDYDGEDRFIIRPYHEENKAVRMDAEALQLFINQLQQYLDDHRKEIK